MTGRIGNARIFLLAVALCAPAALAHAQQANAPRRPDASNPIDVITNGLKFRADPVEPRDFVRETRPPEDKLNYIPTGSPRPQPSSKIMTADQVKAKEAELEAILHRHDRISGRRPAARATTGAAKPKSASAAR